MPSAGTLFQWPEGSNSDSPIKERNAISCHHYHHPHRTRMGMPTLSALNSWIHFKLMELGL